MTLQIEHLKKQEDACKDIEHCVICPGGWSVVWMQIEVHSQESKQSKVVEAILEDIEERHGVT